MEPRSGFEPLTYSFILTPISFIAYMGIRLYLTLADCFDLASLVSRSGDPPIGERHGLNLYRPLTVIRVSA